jgi:hypothetical protein
MTVRVHILKSGFWPKTGRFIGGFVLWPYHYLCLIFSPTYREKEWNWLKLWWYIHEAVAEASARSQVGPNPWGRPLPPVRLHIRLDTWIIKRFQRGDCHRGRHVFDEGETFSMYGANYDVCDRCKTTVFSHNDWDKPKEAK